MRNLWMQADGLPYGIAVRWERLDEAARYGVTLYDSEKRFMSKRLLERDECYCSFQGLATIFGVSYFISVQAEDRQGAIVAEMTQTAKPESNLDVEKIRLLKQLSDQIKEVSRNTSPSFAPSPW
jgi:hypothetical protein